MRSNSSFIALLVMGVALALTGCSDTSAPKTPEFKTKLSSEEIRNSAFKAEFPLHYETFLRNNESEIMQGNRMKFSLTHQSSIKSGSGSRQSGGGYGHEHEQIDHELFFVDSRSPDDSQDET